MPCSEVLCSVVFVDSLSEEEPVVEVDSVTFSFAGFARKFRIDGNLGLLSVSVSDLFQVAQPLHHLVARCLTGELHSLGALVAPDTNRLVNCKCSAKRD